MRVFYLIFSLTGSVKLFQPFLGGEVMSKKNFKWEIEKILDRINEDLSGYEKCLLKCKKEKGEWSMDNEIIQYETMIEQATTEKNIFEDVLNNLEYFNDSGVLKNYLKENYSAFEVELFSGFFSEVDLLYYFDEFTVSVKKRIKNIIKDKINKTADDYHLRELAKNFYVDSI